MCSCVQICSFIIEMRKYIQSDVVTCTEFFLLLDEHLAKHIYTDEPKSISTFRFCGCLKTIHIIEHHQMKHPFL